MIRGFRCDAGTLLYRFGRFQSVKQKSGSYFAEMVLDGDAAEMF